MRIDSSVIGMESARRYTSSTTTTSRLSVKDYNEDTAHSAGNAFGNLLNPGTGEDLSAEGDDSGNTAAEKKSTVTDLQEKMANARANRVSMRSDALTTFQTFRQQTIRSIFSMLFGESRAKEIFGDMTSQTTELSGQSTLSQGSFNVLTVSTGQYYEETESTSFSATGLVKTADGREISINLDIGMSRSFSQYFEQELQILEVNTLDPLVLNFDGGAAELSDQKFYFDLDADGEKEEISVLEGGSGYLALDHNNDGVINDGSELFGTKSGDGFADLAKYDEDGNGWIDEGDAIWSKLKIWCKNEDGTDSLYTLADKGVGAIGLQNARTDFALNGANNQTNGYIRSTGIFLYETGLAGTVQHLDVAQ